MVNACRLYLKVTMLSEIIDADRNYIQQWAMNGTQQSASVLEYPFQPGPPPHAWKIWRDALHATYLDKHREAHRSPPSSTYWASVTNPYRNDTLAPSCTNHWNDDDGNY